ncbi:MAG: methyltransferase domain-containing protein [Anaerolineales bacterium]|nr:methyltransferase domain-containing protein [Anaerolineales bacterium]
MDCNGEESQDIRFDQILKVIEGDTPFSLLDYGCGYGALADYIETKGFSAEYIGFDILESAIETARKI